MNNQDDESELSKKIFIFKKQSCALQEHQSPVLAYVVKTNEINEPILLENCICHTSNTHELWYATNMR